MADSLAGALLDWRVDIDSQIDAMADASVHRFMGEFVGAPTNSGPQIL